MDLQQWMSSIGLNFTPILDGVRHRCDENGGNSSDHIWYVGRENNAEINGALCPTISVGNWRVGEGVLWKYPWDLIESGALKGEVKDYDKEKREKQWEEDRRKATEEKVRDQEAAAVYAAKLWSESKEPDPRHPYLVRKGIAETCSGSIRQCEDTLLIPVQDSAGKLWGIQRIWPDGRKRFLKGQRKSGCYFQFEGQEQRTLYVCEGFATGASIHLATGSSCVVAFDAGNIRSVAEAHKGNAKWDKIVICGDDDRWREDGKNIGREKAEEAAKQVGGIVWFPEFKAWGKYPLGGLQKPTDANDLHCLEGIDEVRRQIESSKENTRTSDETGRSKDKGPSRPNEGVLRADVTSGEKENGENTYENKQDGRANGGSDNTEQKGSTKEHIFVKETGPKEKQGEPDVQSTEKEDDATLEEEYLNCLGHSGDYYFYTTSSNKQIVTLARNAHSSTNLLDLQPLSFWVGRYGHITRQGVTKVSWDRAASDLMERCRGNGIFKPEKVRGVGCWIDGNKLVVHVGDCLIVDNKEVPIGEFKSRYIYELGRSIPKPDVTPLGNDECLKIIDAVSSLNWKHKDDAIYFIGWLAISRLCGALKWRPHVWLTGPSGSGKTTLLDKIAKKLSGDWAVVPVSNSTEAGIRQNICKDALPVIFDEAETSDRRSGAKIQNILSLIRQASSNTDAKIMKGTSDQGGMQFTINSMFLLSSIRVNLIEEQDVNRFTVCELLRNNPEDWPLLQSKIDEIQDVWGNMMFVRMVKYFPALLQNIVSVSEEIAKVHSQRAADQYGPLVAGYLSLITTAAISKDAVKKVVGELEISNKSAIEEEHDELECLNRLLNSKIRIINADGEGRDDSLLKLIDLAFQEVPVNVHHYRNSLQVYGLKISSCGTMLHVANNHPEVYKFFNDTKWHSMWKNSLIRIGGARKSRSRFGSINPIQCVDIPKSCIII